MPHQKKTAENTAKKKLVPSTGKFMVAWLGSTADEVVNDTNQDHYAKHEQVVAEALRIIESGDDNHSGIIGIYKLVGIVRASVEPVVTKV